VTAASMEPMLPAMPGTPPRQPPPAPPLMVRLDGPISITAVKQFGEMGVPLTEPSYLLHLVPSIGGKLLVVDSSARDFTFMLIGCGALTFLVGVFIVTAWIAMKRRDARARRSPLSSTTAR